jgi:hypothetical protein
MRLPDLVWYVTYGSNMHAARFSCYLLSGTPPGGTRANPGSRDKRPHLADRPVELPGGIYFALESPMWSGGMAFYDETLAGMTAARAYLVTPAQFSDIASQEMYRHPISDLDLTTVLRTGRDQIGPGRYETLICPSWLDGYPLLTFTAPWYLIDVTPTAPAAPYLRMLGEGIHEAHGWDVSTIANYLASLPGAKEAWSPSEIEALLPAFAA